MVKRHVVIATYHCILLIFNLQLANLQAEERLYNFYQDAERGWYYFEQSAAQFAKRKDKSNRHHHGQPNIENLQTLDTMQQLDLVQKELEYRKAQLVLYPTVENARHYISFQKSVFDNASKVSEVWQTALIQYPELDSRILHPVSEQAARIKHLEDNKKIEGQITEFARNFELILFYKSSCGYCHAFAPVLQALTKQYGFTLSAISLDGGEIEGIATINHHPLLLKLSKQSIETTPTLIAYNQANQIYLPVTRGFAPEEELRNNIIIIYRNITTLANS
jgi:conjugal transfer pilus assembly protein TraF